MKGAAFHLRCAVSVAAMWLAFAPAVSAQTYPLFTATAGGEATKGPCTITATGGIDSPTPVVYEENCAHGAGAASANPSAVAVAARASGLGNSVLVQEDTNAVFKDQVTFTSTDPNATFVDVAVNVDFALRLHRGVGVEGSVQLSGGERFFKVSWANLDVFNNQDANFTRINDSSVLIDANTFEQHVLLRTTNIVGIPLNTPVYFSLNIVADARADGGSVNAVDFAGLTLPTGIDVFTLPQGVTANAPGSFLVNNRFVPPTPDVSVAPTAYDFGNVNLGSSADTLVTISNTGGLDLTVSGISLENGGSSAIAVTQAPALPVVIHPNGTVDVRLTYTPTTTFGDQAILDVSSDDPDQGVVHVGLSGVGIQTAIPPLQQIAEIIAFIDASAGNGSLVGSGSNFFSSRGRLSALRNMIIAVSDLIRDGFVAAACDQLHDAYQRTDGVPKPPDFVSGPAAAELAKRIQDLRTTLGCP